MTESILSKLSTFNTDPNFKFDPIEHKYTYEGDRFISVTQFISKFHEKYDSDYWSKYKAEESGRTQAEVLDEWKKTNERSLVIGNATHIWIENYFNRIYQELPDDLDIIDRINKFNIAFGKYLYKLTPLIFEQRIFSKKWRIAGMMDSLFLYKDKVIIMDWKTNKLFTDDDHYKGRYEKLLYPFPNYWKNHFNEYSIQVSLYRLILREIGIDVKACYLLHIGPEDEAKMYTAINFTDMLSDYLNNEWIKTFPSNS